MRRPTALLVLLAVPALVLAGCASAPTIPGAPPSRTEPTRAPGQAPTPIPSPVPSATLPFQEDWENPTLAWTVDGSRAARECAVNETNACALRLEPACCNKRLVVEHRLNVTLDAPLTLRFAFKGERRGGDTDTEVRLVTDQEHVVFSLTRPSRAGNAGMSLDGGEPNDPVCGEWPAAGTWYEVTVRLDPAAGRSHADVTGPDGARIGSCSYPLHGSVVSSLRFDAVDYGSGLAYWYDDVWLEKEG